MDNVQDLEGKFARVEVVAVDVVGDVGDVEAANVGDEGQALEEVVLFDVSNRFTMSKT